MRTLFRALRLAAALPVAVVHFAAAEEKSGRNLDPYASYDPESTATLALAHALYRRGLSDGDALTVLTAARLAAEVQSQPGNVTPVRTGDPDTWRDTASNEPGGPPSVAMMFDTARDLAGGDPTLGALVADAMAETSRGSLCCSMMVESRLPAGLQEYWEIKFLGNNLAEVSVIGDGSSNLDVLITDENGNIICYDVSSSDQVYCDWVPKWDGYFYVTVENTGNSRNTYYLLTN